MSTNVNQHKQHTDCVLVYTLEETVLDHFTKRAFKKLIAWAQREDPELIKPTSAPTALIESLTDD